MSKSKNTFQAPVTIPEHLTDWLVIVPNYWGKGKTREEAFQKLREAGGKAKKRGYIVYRCEPTVRIDSFGMFCFVVREDFQPCYLEVENTA